MALADCAVELLYMIGLLAFIGHEHDGPVDVYTDNKGAHDICHRMTSSPHSRHVERKVFKMRELRGAGVVNVMHVPTDQNPADIFTKIVPRQTFEKHIKAVLNTAAGKAVDDARAGRARAGAGAAAFTSLHLT